MGRLAIFALAALPLAGQAWDIRLEVPLVTGQALPRVHVQETGQSLSSEFARGKGGILTVSHRIVRVGPVLRFEWNAEIARFAADGLSTLGHTPQTHTLVQNGLGLGATAQFWIPFTGVAGELGVIGRVQNYSHVIATARQDKDLARLWLRTGLRWRLPIPGPNLYLSASFQQPLGKKRPVDLHTVDTLQTLLDRQGTGQEFSRLWALGAGVQF